MSDGVEIADRYGLPVRIREMIPQHHGTRLVSFFYQRATEFGNSEAKIEDFSYPGPRPQSKEAALVMMADSVEAAARAQRDHSPEALKLLVEKIVLQRLAEGQLDECDLTLRDLQRIRESFTTLLTGMYHPRIEYPERAVGRLLSLDPRAPRLIGEDEPRRPPLSAQADAPEEAGPMVTPR